MKPAPHTSLGPTEREVECARAAPDRPSKLSKRGSSSMWNMARKSRKPSDEGVRLGVHVETGAAAEVELRARHLVEALVLLRAYIRQYQGAHVLQLGVHLEHVAEGDVAEAEVVDVSFTGELGRAELAHQLHRRRARVHRWAVVASGVMSSRPTCAWGHFDQQVLIIAEAHHRRVEHAVRRDHVDGLELQRLVGDVKVHVHQRRGHADDAVVRGIRRPDCRRR